MPERNAGISGGLLFVFDGSAHYSGESANVAALKGSISCRLSMRAVKI
jgi:hypothetical protein